MLMGLNTWKRTRRGNPSSCLVFDSELPFCIILSKCTLYLLIISYFKVLESYPNWTLYWELWPLLIHKHLYLPKFRALFIYLCLFKWEIRETSLSFSKNNNFSESIENVSLWDKYLCCLISPRAIKHCVVVLYQRCLHYDFVYLDACRV